MLWKKQQKKNIFTTKFVANLPFSQDSNLVDRGVKEEEEEKGRTFVKQICGKREMFFFPKIDRAKDEEKGKL